MRDFRTYAEIVKQRVSARTVGEDLGLNPNRDGRCRCLFHADRNPAMKLYNGSRGYYCFACHAGGDVIDLTMKALGIGRWDALRHLNDLYGLGLDLDRRDDKAMQSAKREAEKRAREREAAQKRQEGAVKALWDASDYLDGLESMIRENAPETPLNGKYEDVDFDPVFAAALILRCEAREEVEDAQDRLFQINMERLQTEREGGEQKRKPKATVP